jgi:hypothetical protein
VSRLWHTWGYCGNQDETNQECATGGWHHDDTRTFMRNRDALGENDTIRNENNDLITRISMQYRLGTNEGKN